MPWVGTEWSSTEALAGGNAQDQWERLTRLRDPGGDRHSRQMNGKTKDGDNERSDSLRDSELCLVARQGVGAIVNDSFSLP